jgi:hypothetical protein
MKLGSSKNLHAPMNGIGVMEGFFNLKSDQFNVAEGQSGNFLGYAFVLWEKAFFWMQMMHPEDIFLWENAISQWQCDQKFPDTLVLRLIDNNGQYQGVVLTLDRLTINSTQQQVEDNTVIPLKLVMTAFCDPHHASGSYQYADKGFGAGA